MNIHNPRLAVLVLAAAMSMSWSTSSYGAGKAETSQTMLQLSAKAADEKAKRDLLSMLQPAGKFTRGNRIRVSGITVDTVPYGAGFKGLCRMDELFLVYGSRAVGANNINDPLQPVGVDAERQFHVNKGPVTDIEPFARQAAWDDGDCRKLQSDTSASWFSAPTSEDAAKAVNMFLAAMAAIRSDDLKASDCHLGRNGKTCEEQILGLGPVGGITSVDKDCGPFAASGVRFSECYKIRMGGYGAVTELTIVASFEAGSVEPVEVQSISARQFVVVT